MEIIAALIIVVFLCISLISKFGSDLQVPGKKTPPSLGEKSPSSSNVMISAKMETFAQEHNWEYRWNEIKGNYSNSCFVMRLNVFGWNLKIATPSISIPEFELNHRRGDDPETKKIKHKTGDPSFDKTFSVFSKNPLFTFLFLTRENRDYLRKNFADWSSVTFSSKNGNLVINFLATTSTKSLAPSPEVLTRMICIVEELGTIQPEIGKLIPLISEEQDNIRQKELCNAAFIAYFGNPAFQELKEPLLSHTNVYIQNLTSLMFESSLVEKRYTVYHDANMLIETYLSIALRWDLKIKTAPLEILFPGISSYTLKKRVVDLLCTDFEGEHDSEAFLVSLLTKGLRKSELMIILETLKKKGHVSAIEGLKKFQTSSDYKQMFDTVDKVIKTIIGRGGEDGLTGRLSISSPGGKSAGLSIADEEIKNG